MNYFVFFERDLILNKDFSPLSQKDFEFFKEKNPESFSFEEKQNKLSVLELDSAEQIPSDFVRLTLRDFYAQHSDQQNFFAFRAKAILEWHKNTVFCPKCGTKLINHYENSTKECQNCKKMHFPRIEPCIIVVVEKDGKILLARHIHRNQDIYACVAGFIEAGESAEQAVERELFEETGIKVKNVTYRGSQSWPFPDQLMLGFTAEYQSGEINIQKEEIADAQFFDPNNLPPSPKEGSIAYRLINKIY